ncbi:MAG: serine/threonine protein kinase, partial [Verrucomicrobiales bacterium]|nr:serine/threonine protein kinase [Verrucomicrobiales bacterium]
EENALAEAGPCEGREYFAGYELLEVIGSGAMGVVYRARQISLNRIVALKMLRPARLLTPEDLRRFAIEAEAIARLTHPNIVPIYESGEERGQPFYTTRYVEGGSLAQRLAAGAYRVATGTSDARVRGLRWRKVAEFLREAARAVQHAHDRGVLHRDLKPGNILIDPDGHPQIVDFGLARLVDSGGDPTLSRGMLGTPAYVAPEQAQGVARSASPLADVYSLGAVMYEMLACRPPFLAETEVATVHRIVHDEPVAPCVIDPRIPIDLQTICLKCLEKEPRRRYGSAREMAEDLGRWLGGAPISARPQRSSEKAIRWVRRNPLPASLGLVALVLLLATVGVSIRHARLTTTATRSLSAANRELEDALDRLTLQKVDDRLHQGESVEAIALLARVLREDPSNSVAASRMVWWLSHRSLPLHVGRAARHEGRVLSAQFDSVGGRFVTASEDGSARVWDARTGLPVSAPLVHPDELSWAEFGPDGRSVLVSCRDGAAYLWEVESGRLRDRLNGVSRTTASPGETGHAVLARFSPDGRKIVTGGVDGAVRIWDVESPGKVMPPMRHGGPVLSVAFSPDSRWLLTGSSDRAARLWDASTGEPVTDRLRNHGDVACVNFSPDGTRFVTASFNGTVRIWWTSNGLPVVDPLTHAKGVRYAVFSPDGRRILTSSIDSTARVWNADTGAPLTDPFRHDSTVRVARFSPDGKRVLTASDDTTARIWDIASQRPICEPLRHGGYVVDASFSPDGSLVLTASADGTARVWRIREEPMRNAIDAGGAVRIAAFGPTGGRIATGRSDGVAQVWSLAPPGPVTPRLESKEAIHDLAFSPDEALVATASADHATRLWEVSTGRLLHVIPGHG